MVERWYHERFRYTSASSFLICIVVLCETALNDLHRHRDAHKIKTDIATN